MILLIFTAHVEVHYKSQTLAKNYPVQTGLLSSTLREL